MRYLDPKNDQRLVARMDDGRIFNHNIRARYINSIVSKVVELAVFDKAIYEVAVKSIGKGIGKKAPSISK